MTSLFIPIAGATLLVFTLLWVVSIASLWLPHSRQERKWKAAWGLTILWTLTYLGVAYLEGCAIISATFGRRIARGVSLSGISELAIVSLSAWIGFGIGIFGGLTLLMLYYRDKNINKIIDRFKEGDREGAIAAAWELIAVKGPSQARFQSLYEMLGTVERRDEAIEVFETARRLGKQPEVHPASAYEKLGRYDDALAWRLREYRCYPGAFTCANYSVALARVGRVDEARTVLERGEKELAKLKKQVTPKDFEDLRRRFDESRASVE